MCQNCNKYIKGYVNTECNHIFCINCFIYNLNYSNQCKICNSDLLKTESNNDDNSEQSFIVKSTPPDYDHDENVFSSLR
jgi:hypothetical protein